MRRLRRVLELGSELGRVLAALPGVEIGRLTQGPRPLLENLRQRGARARARDTLGRARLQRAIGWVDAHLPGGANCYRRVLLEIALDREAAGEPLRLGLKAHGGRRSGHAWLGVMNGAEEVYDAEVVL